MTVIPAFSWCTGAFLLPLCFRLLALAACQSVGTQYAFPRESERAATAISATQVFLVSIDHTGCYWGRTAVDANRPFRLKPDELTDIAHEGFLVAPYPLKDYQCHSFTTFTPRQGEHYVLKLETTPMHKNTDGKQVLGRCESTVWRQQPNGNMERVPNEPRPKSTRHGFSCLMPEKTAAEKQ